MSLAFHCLELCESTTQFEAQADVLSNAGAVRSPTSQKIVRVKLDSGKHCLETYKQTGEVLNPGLAAATTANHRITSRMLAQNLDQ